MYGLSARGMVEYHDGWGGDVGVALVIRNGGPEIASLGFPLSGIEQRRLGFSGIKRRPRRHCPFERHEDTISAFQPLSEVIDDRTEVEAGAPNPVGQASPYPT